MKQSITQESSYTHILRTSEQARLSKRFNLKIKHLYSNEPNLANRLRVLMQARAKIETHVKKNCPIATTARRFYPNLVRYRN